MANNKNVFKYLVVYIAAHSYNVVAVRPTKAMAMATAKLFVADNPGRTYWVFECVGSVSAKECK